MCLHHHSARRTPYHHDPTSIHSLCCSCTRLVFFAWAADDVGNDCMYFLFQLHLMYVDLGPVRTHSSTIIPCDCGSSSSIVTLDTLVPVLTVDCQPPCLCAIFPSTLCISSHGVSHIQGTRDPPRRPTKHRPVILLLPPCTLSGKNIPSTIP